MSQNSIMTAGLRGGIDISGDSFNRINVSRFRFLSYSAKPGSVKFALRIFSSLSTYSAYLRAEFSTDYISDHLDFPMKGREFRSGFGSTADFQCESLNQSLPYQRKKLLKSSSHKSKKFGELVLYLEVSVIKALENMTAFRQD
ncbi:hypothetical protein WA026_019373 [Henosepilachna vigintioctopunctata]|uniref:Uncharacterized protein n=1 Tax=Henosepilachna vigintioctopunctata TaxID=420089 RepID=A0AAW1U1U2_9CUCU